jgi:hypothetical protein
MKTVVGLMNNREEAQLVVQDLVNSGFQRDAISIMAGDQEGLGYKEGLGYQGEEYKSEGEGEARTEGAMKGAGTGAAVGGAAGLLVGLTGLAIPGIGPIIAAGPIAALFAGAGVGAVAGGAIGALTKMGVPEEDAHYYAEGVKRGGFLVTVSADDQNADLAAVVMRRHGAIDIDQQAQTWRQEGWTRFDETAPYAESSQQVSNEVPAAASRQFYEREAMTEANASAEFEERSNVQEKQELEQKEVPYAASSQEFYQRDAGLGESGSSQLERETIPRAAGSDERLEGQLETGSVTDDEELDRYFSNTYGSRREGFEAYRSAFHYAEVKSCEPQLCDKEWPEVEEVIHQDWERTHPGTWYEVKEAIHLGWDKRRHH